MQPMSSFRREKLGHVYIAYTKSNEKGGKERSYLRAGKRKITPEGRKRKHIEGKRGVEWVLQIVTKK